MKKRLETGRRERRGFSAEFKAETVRLVKEGRAQGKSLVHLGRELDVRPDQLRIWVKQAAGPLAEGRRPGETLEQEVRRLRGEVDELRQEKAFAKKVAVYFAKESR
jgi:transposase